MSHSGGCGLPNNAMDLALAALSAYIMRPNQWDHRTILDLAPGFGLIYGVADLAVKTGVPAAVVGKIRARFPAALAQALTPGKEPVLEVVASKLYGRTAISIRRKKS